MTDRHTRHRCVVCQTELPPLTRAEALQKGAAVEVEGKTYYRCIGRHTHDEVLAVINGRPKFVRAGSCK
jgi:hypothetical protein